jgi:outer membrane protein assembly factor BamA
MLFACNTAKQVPDGSFLLNKVRVTTDAKNVKPVALEGYVKQKANSSKFRVGLYNLGDSTNSFKRFIRKLGEAPVIYNPKTVSQSVNALRTEMKNKGYLHTEVSSLVDTVAPKKININYSITSGEPYKVRNYTVDFLDKYISSKLKKMQIRLRSKIKEGTMFDASLLEEERQSMNRLFHNTGYYSLATDNMHYLADTALRSNQVDLILILQDTTNLRPYFIRKVSVYSGYDPISGRRFIPRDSTIYNDLHVFYDASHFIRPHVLYDNTSVRPGQLYSEQLAEETYNLIGSLSAVSKAGIEYQEVITGDSLKALDCNIYLTPGNIHGIQMGLDGTNNAGDLGLAGNISYTHNNIFNGSEMLNIKFKGAYEFITGTSDEENLLAHNYYEAGIETSLTFPKIIFPLIGHKIKKLFRANTRFGLSLDMQSRPEYIRNFFNATWKYKWENLKGRLQHNLNVLDVNFVDMPYKSQTFNKYINAENNYLTKVSYDNVFTAGIGYSGLYTNLGKYRYFSRLYTLRYGMELSGNLLSGLYHLGHANVNANGQYELLGNPFAQYVKADFDYSQAYRLNEKNTIALHGGFGIIYPYGNSRISPFEKRYYGGGPNNVRGWNTRQLGPGAYDDIRDFSSQTGDLKLLFNVEYRYKFVPLLEFAGFLDAGNIWTIRNYSNQPGGQFQWHSFYEEIAMAAGIGLRIDLSFLIIRIDAGKKLYDPVLKADNPWIIGKKISGNTAVHFAIGYPF